MPRNHTTIMTTDALKPRQLLNKRSSYQRLDLCVLTLAERILGASRLLSGAMSGASALAVVRRLMGVVIIKKGLHLLP